MGIQLVLVSIGTPDKGQKLVEHLEFTNGEKYLFVDPENNLYNSLLLNKGVKETFFSIETPFAFLKRFTQPDGMKELGEVLKKWNRAFFIPPKQDQAFIQGGTFVFAGSNTVYAHYDASTGAHSDIDEVIDLAKNKLETKTPAGAMQ
mmetsp:Transcript_29055/g.83402  ORF Transcript_29055/g.83402 Transcript_29055/m.83402 type:complete len:147 (+) Transcript_29055:454-894(+)